MYNENVVIVADSRNIKLFILWNINIGGMISMGILK